MMRGSTAPRIRFPGRCRCWKKRARLGELLKQGWKPKRTIIYCAWDGEEPVLLGSTEWAEAHADELQQHAAVYINSRRQWPRVPRTWAARTRWRNSSTASPRDIEDPETKMSVWKRAAACRISLTRIR